VPPVSEAERVLLANSTTETFLNPSPPPFTKGRCNLPLWERGIKGDFHGLRVTNSSCKIYLDIGI
jgi:hypothetical protein